MLFMSGFSSLSFRTCSHVAPAQPCVPARHVVAIRPGALGDTLLVFPTLALIRAGWPGARVTLVARRDVLPLARAWDLADSVAPYDAPEWSALFIQPPPVDSPLRAVLADSAALAWLTDSDGSVAANLQALGAHRVAIGPGRPREDGREHAALQLAALLPAIGIPVPRTTAALYDSLRSIRLPHQRLPQVPLPSLTGLLTSGARVVALHPGSGGAEKRWPPDRFAALCLEMRDVGLCPLLIEGPQDAEMVSAVLAAAGERAIRPAVARGLSVPDLAEVLARCDAYVGNDSGVSHLAGLLGVPTLALFGPSDPAVWAPLGPRTRALRAESGAIAALSIAAVTGALRDLLV